MPIINVLHISDLHFQNGNEEQEDFISKFLNDIKGNNLKSLCKFVVFSGDLVQSPELINYEGVKNKFIIPLMKILQLPLDHFYLVPGNHDANINEIELSSENSEEFVNQIPYLFSRRKCRSENILKSVRTHLKHKFDNFLSFSNSLYGESMGDTEHFCYEFNSAHIYTCANTKIGIACINSSLTCFGNSGAENGKIYIGKEQIETLFKIIKNCQIKIAVFHHPLDGTDIYSRDEIRSYLYENFHVILTGHTHRERSYSIVQNDDGVYYNVSSCLFSDDYSYETSFDPTYSFIKMDCEDLYGIAYFRKYYAMRKEFDVDLRMFNYGQNCFSLHKKKKNAPSFSEQAFINLQKPTLIQSSKNAFQNLEEEKAGYNIEFRGGLFIGQVQNNINFSMYSLRETQFKGCTFKSCLFTNTILIDASFQDCHFLDVKFISVDHFYTVEYCDVNDMVAVAGEGGVVIVLKIEEKELNSESNFSFITKGFYYGAESKIRTLSWRSDGKYIAAADQIGNLYVWDVGKSDPVYKKRISTQPIYAVKWSPSGKHFTSSDESGYKLCVYSFDDSDKKITIKNILSLYDPEHNDKHQQQILDCSWSDDANWIATVGIDRNICIWDMSDLEMQSRYPIHIKCSKRHIHSDYVRKVIWNQKSDGIITCGDDGVVKKWNFNPISNVLDLKQEICVKPGEGNNEVLSVVWYSDDLIIAGLRDDDYAVIQNIEHSPKIVNTAKAHKGRIWDMAVNRKNSIVFTIGNGTIKAWFFDQNRNQLNLLCSYESKLLCTGMNFIKCDGLDNGKYLVAKNKDIPEIVTEGTLKDFLLSKGATIYSFNNRKE